MAVVEQNLMDLPGGRRSAAMTALPADAIPCWFPTLRSQRQARQLLDRQRDDAKHQVAEHLGVAAHPHVQPSNSSLSRPLAHSAVERSR